MAGKKLEVGIGADVSDFKKKISEVEFDLKELSKIKIEKIKLGLDTSEINKNITDVKKTLRDLKSTTTDAGNSFGTFNKKTADGGAALTAFSRIAQDAPYGIIGVGNNITNTAEQFGALVKQTGSAGGALKALLSSLSGVGGVLLGVSLLTTGLTLLSQSGLTVSDVLDMLTGKYDKLGAEMAKASQEAAKQSGSEIANMKALVSVAQDETKSRQDRLIAVKELQKEFPAYFGNLSQEQILNGNVTGTVKELTKAIIERARATAFSNKIGELSMQREELKTNLSKEILSIAKAYNLSKEETKQFYKEVKNGANVFKLLDPFKKRVGIFDLAGAIASSNAIKDIRDELINNQKEQDAYTKAIEGSTSAAIKLRETAVGTPKKEKAPKPKKFDFKTGLDVPKEANTFLSELGFKYTSVLLQMDINPEEIDAKYKKLEESAQEFVKNFNLIFSDLAQSGLANLGTSIGEALATGSDVLQAAGQSILQTFSSFLSQLGDQLIKLGLAAVLTGTVLKSIGTISGVGAGLAAIAGGVALKAIAGGINASAQRGIGGGGSFSTRGGSNSSFSSSSGGFSSGGLSGNVVFEISGQKLIGVLNNTLNGNKRLGGAVGLG